MPLVQEVEPQLEELVRLDPGEPRARSGAPSHLQAGLHRALPQHTAWPRWDTQKGQFYGNSALSSQLVNIPYD